MQLSSGGQHQSFPIHKTVSHEWEIVQNVLLNEFSRQKIDASVNELKEEKALVAELLGKDTRLHRGAQHLSARKFRPLTHGSRA
jgi:hypothetical protein